VKTIKKFLSYARPEDVIVVIFLFAAAVFIVPRGHQRLVFASVIPKQIIFAFVTVWFLYAIIIAVLFSAASFFFYERIKKDSSNSPVSISTGFLKEILKITRDFSSFIICIGIYSALTAIIPFVNTGVEDNFLAMFDFLCFGLNPFIWCQQFANPSLTKVLSFCYWSYFVTSPLLAAMLYVFGNKRMFRNLMLALVISALAAYTGYMLVPAVGPQYVLRHLYAIEWTTALVTPPLPNLFKVNAQIARDCFPSLHTAWTVITFYYCWKWKKILAIIYLPVAAGLIIATIYFAYHYFVDIPAGVLTGVISVYLAGEINHFWKHKISGF